MGSEPLIFAEPELNSQGKEGKIDGRNEWVWPGVKHEEGLSSRDCIGTGWKEGNSSEFSSQLFPG